MDLAIYGAQGIALGAYEAIRKIEPNRKVRCFLVTERGENAQALSGVPVMELGAFSASLSLQEKEQIEILIATPEDVMSEIERELDARGFSCHVRLHSPRWTALMGYFYACGGRYMPLSAFPVGYHKAKIHVFMAKSHKDKERRGFVCFPEWIIPIQAGACLCEERIAQIQDCEGENISEKNVNYSELTALYWIWKNRLLTPTENEKREYYGLVHYRRLLELTEDDAFRLADNGIDVVLPYPMPYEPDIHAHHKRYLADADWRALEKAVEELQPEYAEKMSEILGQRYMYNYNIMLARKEILADYCGWLFPILERTEMLSEPKGCNRNDRYIGYMGETLATLYFMANRQRLHIAHTGCRFLT